MGGLYATSQSRAIGLTRDHRLIAGIIYENFNQKSVVCHIAIQGRVTPAFLSAISCYAFVQLRAHKIIAPVYSDNAKSIRMVMKMGFFQEGRIRDAQPNGHILIFTMTKEQCPYLEARYNG